jgi:PPK2 family polyphosphate:nucleotide phosphotransferase
MARGAAKRLFYRPAAPRITVVLVLNRARPSPLPRVAPPRRIDAAVLECNSRRVTRCRQTGGTMARPNVKRLKKFLKPYRVDNGRKFRLRDYDPGDTHNLTSENKREAKELLRLGVEWLAEEQQMLYAQDRWGVLLMFQAMDAAGKDGTIKHVISGVDPQGVQVYSFKSPSSEELDHDFMWRCTRVAPERGRIGIFNRSYYEEVLVVRVHEALLARQKLPRELVTKRIWKERFEDINAYERYMARNGYVILKFFLNVSKREQRRRFLERLDLPEKN